MNLFCDLDGTLIDSSARHSALLKDILNQMDINLNINDYMTCKKGGMNTKSYLLQKGLDNATATLISNEWQKHIEDENYIDMDKIYDDVFPFLKKYKTKYNIILVSARKREGALINTLNKCGIMPFAYKVIAVEANNPAQSKSNAIADLVTRDDVLVGDTEADYECAMLLKIKCYILNRGFRNIEFWTKAGIESYGDLFQIGNIIDKEVLKV